MTDQIDELSNSTLQSVAKKRAEQSKEAGGIGVNNPTRAKAMDLLRKSDNAKYRHTEHPSKVTPKVAPPAPTEADKAAHAKANKAKVDSQNNRGYGEGRYMGDSVEQTEVVDQLDEAQMLMKKDLGRGMEVPRKQQDTKVQHATAANWHEEEYNSYKNYKGSDQAGNATYAANKAAEHRRAMNFHKKRAGLANEEVESLDEHAVGSMVQVRLGGKWHTAQVTAGPHKESGHIEAKLKVGTKTIKTRFNPETEVKPVTEEVESLEEAHKLGDKVEVVKGSGKGTKGTIGEIRHGLFKGAPKTYTVYHGESGAIQVPKEHIRKCSEEVVSEDVKKATAYWDSVAKEKKDKEKSQVKSHIAQSQIGKAEAFFNSKPTDTLGNAPKNEEVESLDELSMDTVKSYKEKVAKNPAPSKTTSNILHKAIRRFAGKERAEDRIHSDEMKKMRERLGLKNEEVLDENDGIHIGARVYHKEHKSGEPHKVTGIVDDQRVKVKDEHGNTKVMFINQLTPAKMNEEVITEGADIGDLVKFHKIAGMNGHRYAQISGFVMSKKDGRIDPMTGRVHGTATHYVAKLKKDPLNTVNFNPDVHIPVGDVKKVDQHDEIQNHKMRQKALGKIKEETESLDEGKFLETHKGEDAHGEPKPNPKHPAYATHKKAYDAKVAERKATTFGLKSKETKSKTPTENPVKMHHIDSAISNSFPDVEPYEHLKRQFPHLHKEDHPTHGTKLTYWADKAVAAHDKKHKSLSSYADAAYKDMHDDKMMGEGSEEAYRKQSNTAWEKVHSKSKGPVDRFITRVAARLLDKTKIDRKTGIAVRSEEVLDEDAAQKNMTNAMDTIDPVKRDAARKQYKAARDHGMNHASSLSLMHQRFGKTNEETIDELNNLKIGAYGSDPGAIAGVLTDLTLGAEKLGKKAYHGAKNLIQKYKERKAAEAEKARPTANEEVKTEKPGHKVGDTVWATSPTNKALTMTGKVTKIGQTLTTVQHKDGSEAHYPHKLVNNDYEVLHPNPKKWQREHLEQTGELLSLTEVKYMIENANGGVGAIAKHAGVDGAGPQGTGKVKKMMGNKTDAAAIAKIIVQGAKSKEERN